ncbi:Lrp/AsnC family transcriptional regulator [Modestobacter versicolor]|uniref:Lrp/AsnC family leucine-responsive transcriptional regulator n=1 Tax=Modestobacter versicolor TaxID=429133 RepID=A0A839XXQ2_9ACTN|nr:Lrp/AsnC family transcriptional regulator [Modestobacter versicolor]MBB3675369.1 Lrp/AsnC family leucine-responsive transcriptional regulator [Modestobacter versicolor]
MPTRRAPRIALDVPAGRSLLDDVNARLLELLAEDPRRTAAELARRVGMSAPAVRERVTRLEEAGVIRGYRLDVDPAALGLPVTAWVRVRPGPGQLTRIADLAARVPEVAECHRISGEDCFLLRVHVASIEALEAVLDRFLVHGQTTSSFVVATPVPARTPAPGPG